jgi:hypothetical protein
MAACYRRRRAPEVQLASLWFVVLGAVVCTMDMSNLLTVISATSSMGSVLVQLAEQLLALELQGQDSNLHWPSQPGRCRRPQNL